MRQISLNVVVFNEEARLEECLLDARAYVDEIVVVDQMSTDRTPEIAQRLADVYIRDIQHGHAEPSRELAAARSSGEWILILDADEKMSDLLKAELPRLVTSDRDGYWILKSNLVDGFEVSTVEHYRLVRKARTRFDPRPHGGATALTDNIGHFEPVGIIHEKSGAEQIYDDPRYERLALEDEAPTSSKRNWLSHNRTLRAERQRRRRRTSRRCCRPTPPACSSLVTSRSNCPAAASCAPTLGRSLRTPRPRRTRRVRRSRDRALRHPDGAGPAVDRQPRAPWRCHCRDGPGGSQPPAPGGARRDDRLGRGGARGLAAKRGRDPPRVAARDRCGGSSTPGGRISFVTAGSSGRAATGWQRQRRRV